MYKIDIEIHEDYGEHTWAQERFLVHGLTDVLWTSDKEAAFNFFEESINDCLNDIDNKTYPKEMSAEDRAKKYPDIPASAVGRLHRRKKFCQTYNDSKGITRCKDCNAPICKDGTCPGCLKWR